MPGLTVLANLLTLWPYAGCVLLNRSINRDGTVLSCFRHGGPSNIFRYRLWTSSKYRILCKVLFGVFVRHVNDIFQFGKTFWLQMVICPFSSLQYLHLHQSDSFASSWNAAGGGSSEPPPFVFPSWHCKTALVLSLQLMSFFL